MQERGPNKRATAMPSLNGLERLSSPIVLSPRPQALPKEPITNKESSRPFTLLRKPALCNKRLCASCRNLALPSTPGLKVLTFHFTQFSRPQGQVCNHQAESEPRPWTQDRNQHQTILKPETSLLAFCNSPIVEVQRGITPKGCKTS